MVSNQHFDEAVEVSQDESTMDDSGLMNSTDMRQQQHLHPTQDRSNRPIGTFYQFWEGLRGVCMCSGVVFLFCLSV